MPRGVGSLMAFLSVPYLIPRIGARRVLVLGLVIAVTALYQMGHFDLSMTAAPIMTTGVFQGFGVGLLFAPLNTLAYATLSPVHRTEGTIVNTMARSLGSSLGISMISASLTSFSAADHSVLAAHVSCGDPVFGAALPALMNPCNGGSLEALNGEVTRQAAMIAYDTIFSWMALGTLCLSPLLLLMRPPPPMRTIAQEMAAE